MPRRCSPGGSQPRGSCKEEGQTDRFSQRACRLGQRLRGHAVPRDMAELAKGNGPCRCAGNDEDRLWTLVDPALVGVGGGLLAGVKGLHAGGARAPTGLEVGRGHGPHFYGIGIGTGEVSPCPHSLWVMKNAGQGRGPTRRTGAITWRTQMT